MSEQAQAEKPGVLLYVLVAAFLTVLTAMEVAVSYLRQLHGVLVPILAVLSGAKFVLVVMFYMHLKYDSWTYTVIFVPLMVIAAVVTSALIILMATFYGHL
jgi:cytochrome c oxidase subunit 4